MLNTSSIMPNMYQLGYQVGNAMGDLYSQLDVLSATTPPQDGSTVDSIRFFVAFIWQNMCHWPVVYKNWWLELVRNDPIHVLVETVLLVAIVYILVSRTKDWKEHDDNTKLTPKEEKELLREWKMKVRQPLAPRLPEQRQSQNVVRANKGRTLVLQSDDDDDDDDAGNSERVVLNFATLDYLGRSCDKSMEQVALKALDKYGCGACGPRGFYGTVDVHLELEKTAAEFMGTDDAILYSDGASTVTSTVAAFCKRGDLIIVDQAVYEPLMTGVTLSRANVRTFLHNDMQDLRRVLESVRDQDRKYKRKSNQQRRFLIVEGLYKNTGSIVPLDEVVKLKHEFSYRLILDESNSFGVLGETGRGVAELYGQKLMRDVEITTISLEHAVGSIGGVTIGTEEVVDHQRLSGSGYCFSAASPPFTASAAIQSLQLMKDDLTPLKKLAQNTQYMLAALEKLCHNKLEDVLVVASDERSPLIMLAVADLPETKNLNVNAFWGEVAAECLRQGVAVVATGQDVFATGADTPPALLRLTVSALHNKKDMDTAVKVLGKSVDVVLQKIQEEQQMA